MMIKLIAIDIDGTLVNSKQQITQEVKESIQEVLQKEIKVVIATGRPLPGVRHIIDELGIKGNEQYVITYNGGLILSASGNEILKFPIPQKEIDKLNNFSLENNVYMQAETINSAVTTHKIIPYWGNFENALVKLPLHVDLNSIPLNDYFKVMFIDEEAKLNLIQNKVPKNVTDTVNMIRSTAQNLEFVSPKTSKGDALLALTKFLNIDIKDTLAIGDQENDYSMIENAGIGIAMGNAIQRIKNIADFVTTSNDENGVANAITRYILNN
ncbi:MAG: Cof-type HAD-IIB family hydrolase [Lactobacillaceae bacterium]|jgi:Cof subfamily protein (haloacid dehalogenase superfamily)|nr:Cof-type HAD-IIB family hydrolase [Lactobacillaceae bacterium]